MLFLGAGSINNGCQDEAVSDEQMCVCTSLVHWTWYMEDLCIPPLHLQSLSSQAVLFEFMFVRYKKHTKLLARSHTPNHPHADTQTPIDTHRHTHTHTHTHRHSISSDILCIIWSDPTCSLLVSRLVLWATASGGAQAPGDSLLWGTAWYNTSHLQTWTFN